MISSDSRSSFAEIRFSTVVELAVAFLLVVSVKWLADQAAIVGAGSIAIWTGILFVTFRMRTRNETWRQAGLKWPTGLRAWLTSFALVIPAIVLVLATFAALAELFAMLGLEDQSKGAERWEFLLGRPGVFLAYLMGVVWLGAALGEEVFMRGYVLNRLIAVFGGGRTGALAALILHSIIFGFMHSYQGWNGIIGTGIVAVIFGSIYLASKRQLFPVVLAHGLINTIGLTAFYLSDGTYH